MRSFTVLDAPQRSPEWTAARLGRLTGSRAAAMLATVKGGESAGRRNLRAQLALERVTGRPHDSTFQSAAMQTGRDREPAARAWYEALTGALVTETGFLAARTQPIGVSLDGHVGAFEGILEIKCPAVATHLDALMTGRISGAHHTQIVHALYVSGARWCDWVSFNPEFPPALRARIVRVERDEREMASYALAAALFLREVETAVERLQTRGEAA